MSTQLELDPQVQKNIDKWLNGNYDEATKAEIREMLAQGKEKELTDAFYKDLEFGTGGLRGIMGTGSNKVNKYTIGAATQGLANYLKKNFPNEELSAAIAYDSRNNSDVFAKVTADVFTANGIKVYLFEALRATPELSFAIRHFGCQTGIVLTASHNPKEYNGYKAYWNDGAQVIAPHDTNIIDEVLKVTAETTKFEGNDALLTMVGAEVDEIYTDKIAELSISKEAIQRQKDLKIVFTPIHGTAITTVPMTLKKFGFENVHTVAAQAEPNGNFPTVVYPNPEEAEALSMAMAEAKELDADLVLATDPDADRVGIAVKNPAGEWELLNGNQTGALLIYYMLDAWKAAGKLDGKQFVVKTVVTTELIADLAKAYNVKYYDTLTGFKFIASVIRELEGKETFIAGGEESYGYLIGDAVRDKDAVASCAFIAEMTAYFKDKGSSLYEAMQQMYVDYGFYYETLISLKREGKAGQDEIKQMMSDFRANPPKELAGSKVVAIKDYDSSEETNLETGAKAAMDFPKSNVLQFITADGTKVSARPSGTEPKIKFYFGVKADLDTVANFDAVKASLVAKIDGIIKEMDLK